MLWMHAILSLHVEIHNVNWVDILNISILQALELWRGSTDLICYHINPLHKSGACIIHKSFEVVDWFKTGNPTKRAKLIG